MDACLADSCANLECNQPPPTFDVPQPMWCSDCVFTTPEPSTVETTLPGGSTNTPDGYTESMTSKITAAIGTSLTNLITSNTQLISHTSSTTGPTGTNGTMGTTGTTITEPTTTTVTTTTKPLESWVIPVSVCIGVFIILTACCIIYIYYKKIKKETNGSNGSNCDCDNETPCPSEGTETPKRPVATCVENEDKKSFAMADQVNRQDSQAPLIFGSGGISSDETDNAYTSTLDRSGYNGSSNGVENGNGKGTDTERNTQVKVVTNGKNGGDHVVLTTDL